jgi:hypothetical protein
MGGDSETGKPIVAKEVKALVSEVFEGPNANVGALPTGKTLGLRSIAIEFLIPTQSCCMAFVPDEGDNAQEHNRYVYPHQIHFGALVPKVPSQEIDAFFKTTGSPN